jgi:hypothetical protein
MIYLTYNDQPTGVYSSQVNDVCNYLNRELNAGIRLVAIISLHDFGKNKQSILSEVPDALVIPALPMARFWKFSAILFAVYCFFTGQKSVIARNVMAAKIALAAKRAGVVRKVCFDGRGAIAAEWKEYDVVAYPEFKRNIADWEKDAVINSDFRIAVSEELVKWWGEAYGYNRPDHAVIPCTLQSNFSLLLPDDSTLTRRRVSYGFAAEDIILVYSGSASGWQSFRVFDEVFGRVLSASHRYKLVFMSKPDDIINEMKVKYPNQVSDKWFKHSEVQDFLQIGDYGILYREKSITNRVASPTKFAEYLSAGLPVIISEGIGDYSLFVSKHGCGHVLKESDDYLPERTVYETRNKMISLVKEYFTKDANKSNYIYLLSSINKV